ncbi:LLM class flavin-dependent oxidoreductase [Brucella anthropi]|uniref:LLM class flavin-dependent oxidoreductase n=1 Tax=Brucella/Ochrobactrum group TaxID=2826938 RepID=UPI000F672D8E|nr:MULTISPECIES: LLM class flavin-dependent oxidoreductase [Brucella/Ochrobactrum group]KAB2761494.1 LLM class flavin-dependent oxidoreductase [Brucella anthropi]KAB2775963.1 LLM class flavin-dependent oxidoreductase [Brucella anthropi]MCQ9145378.1 LLM class flavin-dependent oxidoreductase [Ochrobactrum sp. BTU2]RRY07856.1 LLM class flavin-dependent oxidoreductase [Brucella anthropi]UGQ23491.1 LLM class flavin-dependent oxidoreductase [Brucella anthropi]
MPYALSFLDKSPIHDGEAAQTALARTIKLAQKAETAGFHRFWVAEHHNSPELASSSPEVLISFLLAHTKHIRIGSGGVMLQHYSTYKVAENFNLLSSLAPGRVDLGVGKAPGGLPLSTRALQGAYDPDRKPSFNEQLIELDKFLDQSPENTADRNGLAAYPVPPQKPERFLLGASVESAELAARLNWDFVYAGHIQGDPTAIKEAVDAYQAITNRPAILAVGVIVAESDAEAERLAVDIRRFRVSAEGLQPVNVGSHEQALEYVRQAGATQYTIEERTPRVIRGTAIHVHIELQRLHREFGIAEFIIDCPVSEGSHRLKTIELLAEARPAIAA